MTLDQLAAMQARLHQMVDDLFDRDGVARDTMLDEEWAWPLVKIGFAHGDDPKRGYTLVVGVEPPGDEAV